MGEIIKRWKDSSEYKKWKWARFFTLYCDSPTDPNDVSEETISEIEKIFDGKDGESNETFFESISTSK